MLHEVRVSAEHYLRLVDRLVPGAVVGFYVVGSAAQGAYRPGRSDIDFVAVVRHATGPELARRLRLLHITGATTGALRAARSGHWVRTGSRNGIFVDESDLTRPATEIEPVATVVGTRCRVGGKAVNPVDWKVLAEHGVAVRGPAPDTLGLDTESEHMALWTLDNLDSYWRPWADSLRAPWRHLLGTGYSASFTVAQGVLGAPRLHCTIATGRVVTKEAAGAYAMTTFPSRWHPLLRHALAYREQRAPRLRLREISSVLLETADFVDVVIESGHEIAGDLSR